MGARASRGQDAVSRDQARGTVGSGQRMHDPTPVDRGASATNAPPCRPDDVRAVTTTSTAIEYGARPYSAGVDCILAYVCND